MSAVVFLDFDGVLNDERHYAAALKGCRTHAEAIAAALARGLDPVRVARVQRICDEAGAGVVVVSGWRRWAGAAALAECLRAAGLTAPVLGVVGGLRFSGDLRADATHEWLRAHPEVTAWVVIDDDVRAWQSQRNVERTEMRDGRRVHLHITETTTAPWLVGHVVCPVDGITDADAEAALVALRGAT